MEEIRNPWTWFAVYLMLGTTINLYTFIQGWVARRRRFTVSPLVLPNNQQNEEHGEWLIHLLIFILLAIAWLPGWLYFWLSDCLATHQAAKKEAWRATPEGQAAIAREYRAEHEQEIRPWISVADLTRRNVPYSELEAEQDEYVLERDQDVLKAFISKMQSNDELACFSTHEETWQRMYGRAGWAIVRGNTIVAQLVTVMN